MMLKTKDSGRLRKESLRRAWYLPDLPKSSGFLRFHMA